METVSVIVPVYNSEKTLPQLVERTTKALSARFAVEIILVNDGSRDASERVASELAARHPNVKVISFRKNFGQSSAILAGMREMSGAFLVVMDDDLQNPPEEIPKIIAKLKEGFDLCSL